MPAGHLSYQGLDLARLDPASEDERIVLLEALHPGVEDALRDDEEMVVAGELVSPRLHITLHQIVANQLLADDPPQTWQTVQRLAALGYDWHTIMHMIARLVSDDIHHAMSRQQPFDPGDYARRLSELPGGWPPPRPLEPD